MTDATFESHPVPDGLAVDHEDIVERLRDLAFRINEWSLSDEPLDENVPVNGYSDLETLNLAISALGGTPVKLMEQSEAESGYEIPY